MSERKPCPFCGEQDWLEYVNRTLRTGVQECWIECANCGARGQVGYASSKFPDEVESLAWYDWNERTNEATQ